MYHSRWKGSHYDTGLRYGSLIAGKGHNFNPPFPLTSRRRDFAMQCLPLYREYAPKLSAELEGFAEGQKLPVEDIFTVFFSMYCFTFDAYCSAFAFCSKEGTYFGRNSDFLISCEKTCDAPLYRMEGGYSFIGHTTALSQIEDGLNEQGLAAGLTMVYPLIVKPGLNAGMLVRLILETCATVKEAVDLLKRLPAASSHHILVADKSGDMALVQACSEKMIVKYPDKNALFAANHFTAKEMRPYQYQGEDTIFSHLRHDTLSKIFTGSIEKSLPFAQSILRGGKRLYVPVRQGYGF